MRFSEPSSSRAVSQNRSHSVYSSPSAKRLKRRTTMFSPVSAITLRTRSLTVTASSFTYGCIISTCSPKTFLSLPLMKSSRLASGTRAIASSSRIFLRSASTTSAGTCSKLIYVEDVPADVVEAERKKILEDEAIARVPEARREDFINGKLKKVFGEQVLMMQPYVKDEAVTISDLVRKVIAETGENIVVRRFSRFALGEE